MLLLSGAQALVTQCINTTFFAVMFGTLLSYYNRISIVTSFAHQADHFLLHEILYHHRYYLYVYVDSPSLKVVN